MNNHVEYSTEHPPVWDELVQRFGVSWKRTAVAYGDTIHAASELPPDVDAHERVHLNQQGYTKEGAARWWRRYLSDPQFRYKQELEAYQVQYHYLKTHIKDRNEIARRAHHLAQLLSSEMYGGIGTHAEALKEITK